jgi:pimeloyl-ACP methyl ester carboxylesterase
MATFLPAHSLVVGDTGRPDRWMLLLHGMLGSGANWRSFARRLAAATPTWGFVLVDLRMHGASQGAPPPHTIAAAADDLVRLGDALQLTVAGVLGHSFGGKVALAYAATRTARLEQAWVLDASPGPRPSGASTVEGVIALLRRLPQPYRSREAFVGAVVAEGHARSFAEWLAMNCRQDDDGLRLRLDLDAIGALLADHLATDLWPTLERVAGARGFDVVVGERSDVFDASDRARLEALAAREPRVKMHLVRGAGHWVHVDAPEALFALISGALASARPVG